MNPRTAYLLLVLGLVGCTIVFNDSGSVNVENRGWHVDADTDTREHTRIDK